jgi:hypothetical protein
MSPGCRDRHRPLARAGREAAGPGSCCATRSTIAPAAGGRPGRTCGDAPDGSRFRPPGPHRSARPLRRPGPHHLVPEDQASRRSTRGPNRRAAFPSRGRAYRPGGSGGIGRHAAGARAPGPVRVAEATFFGPLANEGRAQRGGRSVTASLCLHAKTKSSLLVQPFEATCRVQRAPPRARGGSSSASGLRRRDHRRGGRARTPASRGEADDEEEARSWRFARATKRAPDRSGALRNSV